MRRILRHSDADDIGRAGPDAGLACYFGFCETPEVLVALTRWVGLRLLPAVPGSETAIAGEESPIVAELFECQPGGN